MRMTRLRTAPGLAGRVRDLLPRPSYATARPEREPPAPRRERDPRPVPKRPRTPRDPDRNKQAGMWPDLWAAHRC